MEIRYSRPEDRDEVNRMRVEWYGPGNEHSEEFYYWAFFDRYPEPGLFVVIEHEQKLVGTQAILPMHCRQGDKLWLSSKSDETLLDTICRGQGLCQKMYATIFKDLDHRVDDTVLVSSAIKPLLKAGYADLASIQYTLVFTGRPTEEFPLGRREQFGGMRQKLKRKLFYYLHYLLRFKTKLKAFGLKSNPHIIEKTDYQLYESVWHKMAGQFPKLISMERSKEWVSWRLGAHPNNTYRMLCYEDGENQGVMPFLIDKERKTAFLVDLVACGAVHTVIKALIEQLVKITVDEGWSLIMDQGLSVDLEFQKIRQDELRRFGSLMVTIPNLYFMQRVVDRCDRNESRFDGNNWYYTNIMSFGTVA